MSQFYPYPTSQQATLTTMSVLSNASASQANEDNYIYVTPQTASMNSDGSVYMLCRAMEQQFIIKTDVYGVQLWRKKVDIRGSAFCHNAFVDDHANLYTLLEFMATEGSHLLLMKVSPEGELVWQHSLPGTSFSQKSSKHGSYLTNHPSKEGMWVSWRSCDIKTGISLITNVQFRSYDTGLVVSEKEIELSESDITYQPFVNAESMVTSFLLVTFGKKEHNYTYRQSEEDDLGSNFTLPKGTTFLAHSSFYSPRFDVRILAFIKREPDNNVILSFMTFDMRTGELTNATKQSLQVGQFIDYAEAEDGTLCLMFYGYTDTEQSDRVILVSAMPSGVVTHTNTITMPRQSLITHLVFSPTPSGDMYCIVGMMETRPCVIEPFLLSGVRSNLKNERFTGRIESERDEKGNTPSILKDY